MRGLHKMWKNISATMTNRIPHGAGGSRRFLVLKIQSPFATKNHGQLADGDRCLPAVPVRPVHLEAGGSVES